MNCAPESPHVRVTLDEEAAGMDAFALIRGLKEGNPPIHPLERELGQGSLVFNTFCLRPGEPEIIASRLRTLLVVPTQA